MREQLSSVGAVTPAAAVPLTEAGGGGGGRGSKQSPGHPSGVAGSAAAAQTAGATDGASGLAAVEAASVRTLAGAHTASGAANTVSGRAVAAATEECGAASGGGSPAAKGTTSAVDGGAATDATEEDLASTLNGDVPAWQREAQQQPLVGPRESLTALLRDFKGSGLQYAKARTFLVRLRGQQQQQRSCDTDACSAAGPAATQDGPCKAWSGSCNTRSHQCSTAHNDSRGRKIHSGSCTECNHQFSSSCGGGPGRTKQRSDDSSCGGKHQAGVNTRGLSTTAAAGIEERGASEEREEDEVLQEVEGGPCMRRVRRDGCCFYRGYMFGLLIYFLRNRDKIQEFIRRINEEFRPDIRRVGYDMDTVADFSQEMIDSLEQVEAASAKDPTSEAIVEEIFNEVSSSNYIVVFASANCVRGLTAVVHEVLRLVMSIFSDQLLVSTHMKLNSEMYLPFLTSYATVEEFCKHEVDPMWVAAEELQINALTAMTRVPVEIIYFDRSPGVNPTHHVFPESQKPQIHLLYRPGHYDILST